MDGAGTDENKGKNSTAINTDSETGSNSSVHGSTPSPANATSASAEIPASLTPSGGTSASPTSSVSALLTAPPTSPGEPAPTGNYSSLFGSNYSSAAEEYPDATLVLGKLQMILFALALAVMGLVFSHL
ncbi:MAG: hypothetical protein M1821_001476 [Bathelium mastoideum]|nr:MAG: hypothetical protein M1821_001476 [Bathelium mastoideum]KAI9690005.1 MAG: hypothetical protein M1822_009887 [Bathelium mastoideum]